MAESIVHRLFRKIVPERDHQLLQLKLERPNMYAEQFPDVPPPDSRLSANLIAAQWISGHLHGEDMVEIAADLLEAGYDSPGLRRLAAENEIQNRADAEPFVARVLRELGVPYPLRKTYASLIVTRHIAREVIAGRHELYAAAHHIETALWDRKPVTEELEQLFINNDDFKWYAEQQRFVEVLYSEQIEVFAHLASLTDDQIATIAPTKDS
jgi:hypothetical protein